ncbi:anaerobic sulfite reductase subunit B [Edwardsiella hoshinae]|uniref:Anaerobic sulfite reductase subunit B n=1 Tax=Edwardsiella hoshinae TaxID=93378 RepID=A0A376DGU9_9GAMM|nr:anaerobic sulfite reductase subunit AsrB [Edwardsiella hoshinae]AOV96956.1 anaerobic sulfite reductase subunit B [Edwardsiella hoshinae]QPR27189.1 anaerobic sulfite reductase subunit AsrB [Edwardsiella hoshinae]STC88192.1 Dihydrdoorotate oxidase B, electron transfer subunit [Edwardsiella hoshinae]
MCNGNCEKHRQVLLPTAYPILDIEKHTDLEWNFRVACDFPLHYGQFVEVSLPRVGEAPISVSDYGDGWVDLLIRRVGKVTEALFALQPGDQVWLRGAYGHGYDLTQFYGKRLVVVAGGTGVAPVKGVLRHFCEHPDQVKSLDMILGYKNPQSVLYKRELDFWRGQHNLCLTLDEGEPVAEYYHLGRVTDHLPYLDFSAPEEIQAIVVGPPVMIRATVALLQANGLRDEQIWVDYERRMACSVGKCGHCRMGDVYICVDGPVFNYADARTMVD